ncbi:hypothetical protein OHR86_28020 [Streptomyces sp. NBC_00441]|uniref:hypothetical protein n=1 Tax=Streptomyces sp. NBC_00441 TaxID=2975742 RepID=UPI002E295576|nr:hypothetical protein [Streptomyces sp. NBC_00441]
MRPITGTDVIDFYNTRYDLLVLTTDGEFDYIDYSDLASSSYNDNRATAYNYVTLDNDNEVQVLLERTTIDEGEWFPDALTDDGDLTPSAADDMAAIINNDGILPSRALKAIEASKAWEAAEQTAKDLAAARAAAVNEVAAYAGSQSAAAAVLSLDQSTVNKLVAKHRRATTESAS